jgi:Phage integrase family
MILSELWRLYEDDKRILGFSPVYPHRFRHTYACHLFDNGAPLDFVQGMLGHEKASTTQIYAQLRGERRRELYRRFFNKSTILYYLVSTLTIDFNIFVNCSGVVRPVMMYHVFPLS